MRHLLASLLLAATAGCAAPPPARTAPDGRDDEAGMQKNASAEGDDEVKIPAREQGKRTARVTNQVIKANRAAFRACYDRVRKSNPGLSGKVELVFSLQPDGTVKSAKIDEARSDLRDEALAACLVEAVRAIRFPEASDEMGVTMHYPFDFKPGK